MVKKSKKPVPANPLPEATGKIVKKKKKNIEKPPQTEEIVPGSTSSESELKFLRYSLSEKYACQRHLFLKKDLSSTNSLIVANIPAYLDIDIVKSFLMQFVKAEILGITSARSNALDGSLEFGSIALSFAFESESAVISALNQCEKVGPYKASDFGFAEPESVLRKSIEKYRASFMNAEALQGSIDAFMEHHDEAVQQAKREAKRKCTEPDEEGWITVTKASKKVAKAVKVKKNEIPLTGGLNKKKKAVDLAFYSFQAKQSRLKNAQELRARFEEDKKRVAQLKSARQFKPY